MSVNYLSPESNTFSLCQNSGHGEPRSLHLHMVIWAGTRRHISSDVSTHTQINTLADARLLWVSAENQTVHPSAYVIPSNQSYVAMVKISPHELVNQAAAPFMFLLFCPTAHTHTHTCFSNFL